MNLIKVFLTENECYKVNKKIKPYGIQVHSTGANNPYLKRYIQPDYKGLIGKNAYGNHWNRYRPDGRSVCGTAFIGLLADGKTVATVQTLPFDIECWMSGSGSKGSANDLGYIGFEICEDNLTDSNYFNKVYKEAVEFTAYLCKMYNIPVNRVKCHSELHAEGLASNHGDVMHWFPKHGKSMNTFRNDVAKLLNNGEVSNTVSNNTSNNNSFKVGDTVTFKDNAKQWDGKNVPSAYIKKEYKLTSLNGDRAVLSIGKTVMYAANTSQLLHVGSDNTNNNINKTESYTVRVTVDALNIRSGAGTSYKINGTIRDKGVYTIVETQGNWGKLKSGAGWICLDYTTKL